MIVRFIEGDDEIAATAEHWRTLRAETPDNPLFLSPEWFLAWRHCFAEGIRTGLLVAYDNDRVAGVMPLMLGRVRRGPSLSPRVAYRPGDERFLTNPGSYRVLSVRQVSPSLGIECGNLRGGLVAEEGRMGEVRSSMLRAIAALPGWTLGVFPVAERGLPAWNDAAAAAGFAAHSRPARSYYSRSEVLPWNAFIRTRNSHFRKRLTPAIRRAAELGLVSGSRTGAKEVLAAIDEFFDLGRRSWKEDGRSGEQVHLPVTPATEAFYKRVCGAGQGIVPVLHEMRIDGALHAAMLGILHQRVLVLCLTYFDPAVAQAWPGRLLFRECFDWAAANEVARIDFNATHSGWARFADTTEIYHDLFLFRRDLLGSVLARLSPRFAPNLSPAPAGGR